MLDLYYSRELPLPSDPQATARLIRANSKDERKAVESVLNEFFILQSDGWHQSRADREIAEYTDRAETARVNGKRGGRPKRKTEPDEKEKPKINPEETDLVISGFPKETNEKANQNQNQNQYKNNNTAREEPTPINPTVSAAGLMASELIRKNIKVTSMHPTLLQWIDDKFTLPAVLDAVEIARQTKPLPEQIPANYIDRILRNPPKKAAPAWWTDDNQVMAMARKHGVPTIGKHREQLKSDIFTAMKIAGGANG